ncbi:MAG: hypothetical protein WAQ05_02090 [Rubrivivax sp.]
MSTRPDLLRPTVSIALLLAAGMAGAANGAAQVFRMHNNTDQDLVVQHRLAGSERECSEAGSTSTPLRQRDRLPLVCPQPAGEQGWCVRPAPRSTAPGGWVFLRCTGAAGAAPVELNLQGR